MTLVEVPTKGAGDPFTTTMWGQSIQQNINELIGRSGGNLLTNPGFEIWQRGVGPFSAGGVYTADRWLYLDTGSAVGAVDRESSTIDTASQYSLKLTVTTPSGDQPAIRQVIEDWRQLRGKTVSLSVRVRQSVASMIQLAMNDGVSGIGGGNSATTGAFTTLSLDSYTISASATQLSVDIIGVAAGTAYIDNAMLVIGPEPTEYVPLHPQEDLARCQRYYEVIGGVTQAIFFRSYQAAGATFATTLPLKVSKGGTPTVTKNGTWTVSNCAQPAATAVGANTIVVSTSATALGDFHFFTDSTDDTITAEWNP